MDNSQRQVYEQKIELLVTQIDQQYKREQILRTLNETLQQQFKFMASQKEQLQQMNYQLSNNLKNLKDRQIEDVKYYESENLKLKTELNQKYKECDRKDVEAQRKVILYEEKISMLENIIEKKCNRVGDLQKKLHDQSICGLKETSRISISPFSKVEYRNNADLAVSAIHYSRCETENNMKMSNISTERQNKVGQLMKMDKSKLKVMMGALIKSRRHLDSVENGHQTKRNQTFCS